MRVVVVGGGKVGYYLAKTLLEHGHRPVVIEKNREKCRRIADDLDIPVICDDGSSPSALSQAHTEKADALVSVTGADEDNLVICQLAKKQFNVKRTVARVNNPKNTQIMRKLGVDIPISSTDSLAYLLEREVETAPIQLLMRLNRGKSSLLELQIPQDYKSSGITLSELVFPKESIIVSITRDGDMIIPRGSTTVISGDKLLVVCATDDAHALDEALGLN